MTVYEYMTRRNEIIQKHYNTEFNIVTPSKIEEVKQWKLSGRRYLTTCPYCMEFFQNGCEGCPANKHGHKCSEAHSKHSQLISITGNSIMSGPAAEELKALIEEYNKDLDEGKNNGIL